MIRKETKAELELITTATVLNDCSINVYKLTEGVLDKDTIIDVLELVTSVCTDRDSSVNNRTKFLKRLMNESCIGPSTPLQMIPTVTDCFTYLSHSYSKQRFFLAMDQFNYLTNARNIFSDTEDPYASLLSSINIKSIYNPADFYYAVMNIPKFSAGHIIKHEILNPIMQSNRLTDQEELWHPMAISNERVLELYNNWSIPNAKNYMAELGIRKELVRRYPNDWAKVKVVIGGSILDPCGWKFLFKERIQGWVQQETKDIVLKLKEIIEGGNDGKSI